jgi:hypothetical protein
MSMFPGAGAVVYRNEAGEPLGWDYPSEPDPYDAYDEDPRDYYDEDVECVSCGAWFEIHRSDVQCDDCVEAGEAVPAAEPPVREDFGWFGDEALCGE